MQTSPATYLTPNVPNLNTNGGNRNTCLVFASGYSSTWPISVQNLSFRHRKSVIVDAKKKNEKNKEKVDTHSFKVKPNEGTGPFPEAVLLKEKKVQEDGKLLPEFADEEEKTLFESLNLMLESDLDVERMRHYEVVYLIHENHAEEVEKVNEKVQDFLREKKGKMWRVNDWGLRRLAYKIKKAKNAHYILMNFELEAKWINDFKNLLDKDERVIRHLVIKRDEAITEDCPPPIEFHKLRAGTDGDDDDDEDETDYDDDEDDGDYDDDVEDGVVIVDDDVEDTKSALVSNVGRTLTAEKVGRRRKWQCRVIFRAIS